MGHWSGLLNELSGDEDDGDCIHQTPGVVEMFQQGPETSQLERADVPQPVSSQSDVVKREDRGSVGRAVIYEPQGW